MVEEPLHLFLLLLCQAVSLVVKAALLLILHCLAQLGSLHPCRTLSENPFFSRCLELSLEELDGCTALSHKVGPLESE